MERPVWMLDGAPRLAREDDPSV